MQTHRRAAGLYAIVALAVAALLAGGLAAGALAWRALREADYPGALLVSAKTGFKVWPTWQLRRSTSYQTTDSFSEVYVWYSTRFALGPEKYALGSCNQMLSTSELLWVFEVQMSVSVCDTPTGRMMWVDRALTLRRP